MARENTFAAAIIKRLFMVLLLGATLVPGAHAQPDGPQAPVARLNGALIEVMRAAENEGLDYAGRYERLAPVLTDVFNFQFMTQIAVGPTWRDLSQAERERLIDLFAQMSIATFANRFKGYSGETFKIVEETSGPRDSVLVRSRLVRPADEPVGLDYLLREFGAGWRVIDVFLDSKFSELARQRSEFAGILRRGSVADLVASLENKIATLATP